jgi:SET domain-containing protein
MTAFVIEHTPHKGQGVFAARDIKAGELILRVDMTGLEKYAVEEIDRSPALNGDHADYVGNGKYVIDDSPGSYVNHSCEPNCCYRMHAIARKDLHALRDIRAGEELTHDYSATAIDQFAGNSTWILDCSCGSPGCRRKVKGDYFELPPDLQRRYYANLPASIKRKYHYRFHQLFQVVGEMG